MLTLQTLITLQISKKSNSFDNGLQPRHCTTMSSTICQPANLFVMFFVKNLWAIGSTMERFSHGIGGFLECCLAR